MAATFKAGQRVRELSPPHREGSVRIARGTGQNAIIVVNVDGRAPQDFRPAQLQHI